MYHSVRRFTLSAFLTSFGWHAQGGEPRFDVWTVDSLVKVFQDDLPTAFGDTCIDVARGEHASVQVVVRSDSVLKNLKARVGELRNVDMQTANLVARPPRFIGYVPVSLPIQDAPKDVVRKTPANFPDPLLEEVPDQIPPDQSQPIWITVPIPDDAFPGEYQGVLSITARVGEQDIAASFPIHIYVHHARVGKARLWVTNWFTMDSHYSQMRRKRDSHAYWSLLRKYARNMADHRQNVILISPLDLAEFKIGEQGTLDIDFSRFDRWVSIFEEEGVIGRIEGGHLGDRLADFRSPFFLRTFQIANGAVISANADPLSVEADEFYGQFFPALVRHLKEKGWLDRYMQHLVDEPVPKNANGYRAIAALARKYGPELRIIEACHTRDLIGSIDNWVPMFNFYHIDFKFYKERQRAGEEVWFYTCWKPQKEYANRFVEQPLLKTRLLHWINFRYGATGYLHWGYNQWTSDDPFLKTTVNRNPARPEQYLPAGDCWIVYPGKDGPIDSIRHEAMRDGTADYELFKMIEDLNPEVAMNLVQKHVLVFDRYECDVAKFRETRRELLEALSGKVEQ